MKGKNQETLVFCNDRCDPANREKCPYSHGVDVDHLNEIADVYDEDDYDNIVVEAEIRCPEIGGYDYFNLDGRSKYYNV